MATRKRPELARDSRGYFKRDLGSKVKGGKVVQHRFLLGKNKAQAEVRNSQLERVWDAVEEYWRTLRASSFEKVRNRAGERPLWDHVTLQIAQAVAAGSPVARIDFRRGGAKYEDLADRDNHVFMESLDLERLQLRFPFIRLELVDQARLQEGGRMMAGIDAEIEVERERKRQARDEVERQLGGRPAGDQTLHQALDAYVEWIKKTYLAPAGRAASASTA